MSQIFGRGLKFLIEGFMILKIFLIFFAVVFQVLSIYIIKLDFAISLVFWVIPLVIIFFSNNKNKKTFQEEKVEFLVSTLEKLINSFIELLNSHKGELFENKEIDGLIEKWNILLQKLKITYNEKNKNEFDILLQDIINGSLNFFNRCPWRSEEVLISVFSSSSDIKKFSYLVFFIKLFSEWSNLISENFFKDLRDFTQNVAKIKAITDVDFSFISGIIDEFKAMQIQNKNFIREQIGNFNAFFDNIMTSLDQFNFSLEKYVYIFNEISKISDSLIEISQDTKVLSLNMAVQASKTKGSNVFNILSREQQKLSDKIENNVNIIVKKIKDSLKIIEKEKEDLFLKNDEITKKVSILKETFLNYEKDIEKLDNLLNFLFEKLYKNSKEVYENVSRIFISLQGISINEDEQKHKDEIIKKLAIDFKGSIINCFEQFKKFNIKIDINLDEIPEKEEIFEIVKKIYGIFTTKREKEVLREVLKKYNIDIGLSEIIDKEETKDDVIIF